MKLFATNKDLIIKESERLISGSINIYTCEFTFDSSWDGYTVTAVFSTGNRLVNMAVVDGKCDIPAEVLRPNARVRIGIFGVDGVRRRPTTYTDWIVVEQGADATGTSAKPPTPSVYEQWVAGIDAKHDEWSANEQARVEAENARVEAEQAREDKETGYVAQAEEAAAKAANAADEAVAVAEQKLDGYVTSAEEAEQAARAAQAAAEKARDETIDAVEGDFATRTQAQDYANTAEANANQYTDLKIAEIHTPDVSGQINTHNNDSSAHADIRAAAAPAGFGLGTTAASVTADTILSNLSQNGWFMWGTWLTDPQKPFASGTLLNNVRSAGYVAQIAFDASSQSMKMRSIINGTVGEWTEIYHTGNKPTAADVGAASAEKVNIMDTANQLIVNPWQDATNEMVVAAKDGNSYSMLFNDETLHFTRAKNGVTQKTWKAATTNYALPRDGSARMTGKLCIEASNGHVGNVNDDSAFRIDGGKSYDSGAFISLCGKDYWDAGTFQVVAATAASGTRKELKGKIDGTLTWDGNNILHTGNVDQWTKLTSAAVNITANNSYPDFAAGVFPDLISAFSDYTEIAIKTEGTFTLVLGQDYNDRERYAELRWGSHEGFTLASHGVAAYTAAGTYTKSVSCVKTVERPIDTYSASKYGIAYLNDLTQDHASSVRSIRPELLPYPVVLHLASDYDDESEWNLAMTGTNFAGTVTVYGRKRLKL